MRTERDILEQLDYVRYDFEGPVADAIVATLRWVLEQDLDTPREIVWTTASDICDSEFCL